MASLRFPFWVAVTSAAIVVGLLAAGGVLARTAYAGGPGFGFGGPPWAHGGGFPPFADLQSGKPFTVEVTPGTVTAASATGVTVQVKDGPTRSFGVDAQTHTRGTPAVGDQVVVITKDGSATAAAVFGPHAGRAGWGGHWRGPWGGA
jgi:hypothetical protein